jgi:hypothetical protein
MFNVIFDKAMEVSRNEFMNRNIDYDLITSTVKIILTYPSMESKIYGMLCKLKWKRLEIVTTSKFKIC